MTIYTQDRGEKSLGPGRKYLRATGDFRGHGIFNFEDKRSSKQRVGKNLNKIIEHLKVYSFGTITAFSLYDKRKRNFEGEGAFEANPPLPSL